jgi:GxxExxY protein
MIGASGTRPGLLESVYEPAMAIELEFQKMGFRQQVIAPIQYRRRLIGEHRIDLVVEDAVFAELNSVERFDRAFEAQMLTYLRPANLRTGLLINFNSGMLHEGGKRFVV